MRISICKKYSEQRILFSDPTETEYYFHFPFSIQLEDEVAKMIHQNQTLKQITGGELEVSFSKDFDLITARIQSILYIPNNANHAQQIYQRDLHKYFHEGFVKISNKMNKENAIFFFEHYTFSSNESLEHLFLKTMKKEVQILVDLREKKQYVIPFCLLISNKNEHLIGFYENRYKETLDQYIQWEIKE